MNSLYRCLELSREQDNRARTRIDTLGYNLRGVSKRGSNQPHKAVKPSMQFLSSR